MSPTESEQLKSFGKRIATLRKRQGYSQEEFAEATGKMINTISNIERGLADPKFTTLNAIANTLNVNISDLFYDIPPQTQVSLSNTATAIIALVENMPPCSSTNCFKTIKSIIGIKNLNLTHV